MDFLYRFLFGFSVTFYIILCALLVLIILIQKGKSSMGFGHLGGTSQLLFGGSGGQDLLQKITWVLGAIFIAGSFGIAIVKSRESKESRYLSSATVAPSANPVSLPVPETPAP